MRLLKLKVEKFTMKYQLNAFFWVLIRRVLPWFILLAFLYIAKIYSISSFIDDVSLEAILNLYGVMSKPYFNLENLLFLVFQIGLVAYFCVLYFTFELANSREFVFLRMKPRHFISQKIFFIIGFILFFKFFLAFLLFGLCARPIPILAVVNNILWFFLIPLAVISVCCSKQKMFYFSLVFHLILLPFIFYFNNIFVSCFVLCFLICHSILKWSFQR